MTDQTGFTSQFELFPSSNRHPDRQKSDSNLRNGFHLAIENVVVICIVFVMISLLLFSVGVERGKRLAGYQANEIDEASETDGIIVLPSEDKSDFQSTQASVEKAVEEQKTEVIKLPEIQERTIQKPFTIQVASFKLEENAHKEADKLKTKGFETFVVPKGSYSIVCVGQFSGKTEASQYTQKLKDRYKDCMVRRL